MPTPYTLPVAKATGSIREMKASESPYKTLTWIPTGFSSLDKILGGGVPSRKITEFSGYMQVGKSTLALQVVAQAQKLGMDCLWADSEFSFTEDYATKLGVNCDLLDLIQGRYAEDNLDQIEAWAESHRDSLVVLDSIGGLLPRQEAEKSAEGKTIGGQAKLIATFCRKIVPILAINNVALVVLNHQLIDLMSGKLKTSGGAKLEYAKSIWLMLKAANKRIMSGDQQIGLVIEAEIRKNKLAATMKQSTELHMLYGQGFSSQGDLLEEALDKGLITKQGQFYYFGGEKIGRGQNGTREALKDENLSAKIKQALTI